MKKLLLLLCLLTSTVLSSCGDDPVAVDPNLGKRATISAFYAHPDETLPVYVKVGDSVTISALSYGQFASGLAPLGDRKIIFQTQTGNELSTSGDTKIESTRSVWAVYSGNGSDDEVITVSTVKGTAPAAPLAGVRFIHASKNQAKVKVHQDVAAGSAVTDFVEYGRSNDAFTQINAGTTALVMVNEAGDAVYNLSLAGAAALLPGRLYTVILFGNPNSTTVNKLEAQIKLEPLS